MKAHRCGEPLTTGYRVFRSVRFVRAAAAFAMCAAIAQFAAATERKPPCDISPDSYAVVRSNLEYHDVSGSFAQSFYFDVREIVRGYLANESTAWCFFDSGLEAGAAGHNENTLLDLHCTVERFSNKVILTVRIMGSDTQKSLLSFETSAFFFQPAAALADFAEAFPRQFAGQVVRQYSYRLPPEGFHLPRCVGVFGGEMLLGNVNYTPRDLEEDLRRTEDVPPSVTRSVQGLKIRRGIERTAASAGDLAALVGLVGIVMIKEKPDTEREQRAVLITFAAGSLLLAITAIESAVFKPRRLVAKLNDWRPSE
jgi:hypothetical protein